MASVIQDERWTRGSAGWSSQERDVKGLYAQVRAGEIQGFTGIDDPYEPPLHPDLTLDTVAQPVQENARAILKLLIERGFVRADAFVLEPPKGPPQPALCRASQSAPVMA